MRDGPKSHSGKLSSQQNGRATSDVRRDIGGDEQPIANIETQYANNHVPPPSATCLDRRLSIPEQGLSRWLRMPVRGEVQRERSYSAAKIALLVIVVLFVIVLLILLGHKR